MYRYLPDATHTYEEWTSVVQRMEIKGALTAMKTLWPILGVGVVWALAIIAIIVFNHNSGDPDEQD